MGAYCNFFSTKTNKLFQTSLICQTNKLMIMKHLTYYFKFLKDYLSIRLLPASILASIMRDRLSLFYSALDFNFRTSLILDLLRSLKSLPQLKIIKALGYSYTQPGSTSSYLLYCWMRSLIEHLTVIMTNPNYAQAKSSLLVLCARMNIDASIIERWERFLRSLDYDYTPCNLINEAPLLMVPVEKFPLVAKAYDETRQKLDSAITHFAGKDVNKFFETMSAKEIKNLIKPFLSIFFLSSIYGFDPFSSLYPTVKGDNFTSDEAPVVKLQKDTIAQEGGSHDN